MIVVDSSVWIAQMRKVETRSVRKLITLESTSEVIVGDLVLLEILQGARDEGHAARIERNLRQFVVRRMLDDDVAVRAARYYRALRGEGVTIRKTIDAIIATFCILGDHELLHDDRDFEPFVRKFGLRLA